jgi:hypothetical protein
MDRRIDMKAYPMPPGAPKLMPFQDMPFNGDGYAAAEVLRLKEKHGLTVAVETGTCYGSTAIFLSHHFEVVVTYEIHGPTWEVACQRILHFSRSPQHLLPQHMSSPDGIRQLGAVGKPLYVLDAHWGDVCPLHAELEAIAALGIRPALLVMPRRDLNADAARFTAMLAHAAQEAAAPVLDLT